MSRLSPGFLHKKKEFLWSPGQFHFSIYQFVSVERKWSDQKTRGMKCFPFIIARCVVQIENKKVYYHWSNSCIQRGRFIIFGRANDDKQRENEKKNKQKTHESAKKKKFNQWNAAWFQSGRRKPQSYVSIKKKKNLITPIFSRYKMSDRTPKNEKNQETLCMKKTNHSIHLKHRHNLFVSSLASKWQWRMQMTKRISRWKQAFHSYGYIILSVFYFLSLAKICFCFLFSFKKSSNFLYVEYNIARSFRF